MTIILVIGILVLLIITHEFGHFIAAKISGVKVQEFGVGYPPRAFRFGKVGDTEYTLNWIPFGGFVRLFGDEGETSEQGKGSFVNAPVGKRAFILVAGVVMNMLIAWMLFTSALHMGIPRAVDTGGPGVRLLISDVVSGSPADSAGIRPGDELVGMNDQSNQGPGELSPENIATFVSNEGGQKIKLEYLRNGKESSVTMVPANAVIPGAPGRAALGIGLVFVSSQPLSWSEAATSACLEIANAFTRVVMDVGSIIGNALRGGLNLSGVVGPVGLVSVVGEAAQTGFAQVLALAAFISVNLAVINLIPIPALDGGRLVILGVEALMRRPAPKLAIHVLNLVGVAAILFLMVVVTYHDIARLVA